MRWALALVVLLVSGSAGAAPIIYSFTTGSATLTVESGGVELGSAVGVLTGTTLTFDAASVEIVDFEINLGETVLTLDPPVSGVTTVVVESAVFTPGTGYSTVFGQDLGGGDYVATVSPVDVDGSFRTEGPGVVLPSTPFSNTNPFLTADIEISDGQLSMLGITVGSVTLDSGQVLTLKADLAFTGVEGSGAAIPEPSGALLMGAGLLLVAQRIKARVPA
jgi:hypothetical protein